MAITIKATIATPQDCIDAIRDLAGIDRRVLSDGSMAPGLLETAADMEALAGANAKPLADVLMGKGGQVS